MNRPFVLLLTLAGLLSASDAHAQRFFRRGYAPPATTTYASPAPASYGTTTYSSYYAGPGATSQPSRSYSYSYYTLSTLPPRTYVGYGTEDFPFHGVPYGHPYDPWTWSMMSGSYGNGLARYYDPPVK